MKEWSMSKTFDFSVENFQKYLIKQDKEASDAFHQQQGHTLEAGIDWRHVGNLKSRSPQEARNPKAEPRGFMPLYDQADVQLMVADLCESDLIGADWNYRNEAFRLPVPIGASALKFLFAGKVPANGQCMEADMWTLSDEHLLPGRCFVMERWSRPLEGMLAGRFLLQLAYHVSPDEAFPDSICHLQIKGRLSLINLSLLAKAIETFAVPFCRMKQTQWLDFASKHVLAQLAADAKKPSQQLKHQQQQQQQQDNDENVPALPDSVVPTVTA